MCGISGFIGDSKDPELSYNLISSLFEKIEVRGKDASGFWVSNKEGIIFHKEPIKSSLFVDNEYWKSVENFNPNIALCHAREASSGVGLPAINKNNHPFVNYDKTLALIHNGRIPDIEYYHLLNHYEVNSDCDSEILLRVVENTDDRLSGIKNIWSFAKMAHMAVAIGETTLEAQKLYLFRNSLRTICLIDLRDILGQFYFCSTPEIWQDAIKRKKLKHLSQKRIKLIILPPEEVWCFELKDQIRVERYGVQVTGNKPPVSHPKINLKPPVASPKAICGLDEEDEPLSSNNSTDEARVLSKNIKTIKGIANFFDSLDKKKVNSELNRELAIIGQKMEKLITQPHHGPGYY